jgi:hypothetical protein
MNKPRKSVVPRFGVSNISGESADISNLQIAATVYAFDVPLHKERPYDVQKGDGIRGNGSRIIFHFNQKDGAGNSPKEIAKLYFDENWLAQNPKNPLAICRRAFDEHAKLKQMLRGGNGENYTGPACRITNTRKAAVMKALGHPLLGWVRNEVVTTWCFPQAADTDAILYDRDDLYTYLPDSAISYAKGAILGHEKMIALSKQVTTARVTHRGKTAYIGRDMPKHEIDVIDKLLYRK